MLLKFEEILKEHLEFNDIFPRYIGNELYKWGSVIGDERVIDNIITSLLELLENEKSKSD